MYFDLVADPGMNYTVNRAIADGAATRRLEEARAIAPSLTDFDRWYEAWLDLAKRAEKQERWIDAAHYYHQAEFYLRAGDLRNALYDDFSRVFARGMQGVEGYERIEVPYENGVLPGFRLPATNEKATIVAHGGYDSFIEEWLPFIQPLTEQGYTVIAFDGPGQGGALRHGIYLTAEWEKPAAAVLDHFNLDAVDWVGASCGGYMALRAAAFEPRIKHVVALPATYWGMDMLLKQLTPGQQARLVSLFHAGDREGAEALLAEQSDPAKNSNTNLPWAVTQGMHITGTTNPWDLLVHLSEASLDGILHRVTQDVLLTEGEHDHLFPTGTRIHQIMGQLTNAQSVTTRTFTAREGGEQHCQVGNAAVARTQLGLWLNQFHD